MTARSRLPRLPMTERFPMPALSRFALAAAPAFAQDSIKIGLIVDRVGFAKAWSEPITQGAVYAARELNAKPEYKAGEAK